MDEAAVTVEIQDAISTVLARHGEMVTRMVAIVETIDGAGDRCAWSIVPPDAKAWDTTGLLQWALHREAAGAVHEEG